jgi:mannosyltransferase
MSSVSPRAEPSLEMNILYEGGIYQILRCGGVARCFTELIRHLPAELAPTVVGPEHSPPALEHPQLSYLGVPTEPPISWLRRWTRDRLQRTAADAFDRVSADLEHWTYYSGLCRRPIRRGERPLVVTVLDFVHEAFPELDPSGAHRSQKYEAIHAADRLICISQATFDELCQRFPWAAERACVIPLGTSLTDVQAAPLPPGLDRRPYVLFVGRRNSYKNFSVVWQAWARVRQRLGDQVRLVVAGPPVKRREAAVLRWDGDDRSVAFLPAVSDATLRGLYEHAHGFVFPSKAEGFGLPSLEAMAAGTPVMVSELPVMREVVGDCGYYFDPDEPAMLAEMMIASLEGTLPDQSVTVQAARQRAAGFSWSQTAERTATVYRQLLDQTDPAAAPMMPRAPLAQAS